MEQHKPSKSMSTSTPSFTFRYNPEEEEIEQLYDPPTLAETHSDHNSPQSTPIAEKKDKDKTARRSGSFEDGPPSDKEPWRLFTEFKGRIAKRVEEKLEEINTKRLVKEKIKKEKKERKLKSTNSLSDSEDRSEDTSAAHLSSLSNASSSSPEKTKSLPVPSMPSSTGADESDLGDISGSEDASSSPERPSTPTFTDDLVLHRPRPPSSSAASVEEKKDSRGKMKGMKFKIIKKKPLPELSSMVEVGVDALDEVQPGQSNIRNLSTDTLPAPKRKYNATLHRYPWTAVATIAALFLAFFFPRPSFLAGVLFGILVSFVAVLWSDQLYRWISIGDPENNFLHGNYTCENVPFLSESVLKTNTIRPEDKYFKGWMNEYLDEYDPQTYHISQTETVYAKLVGSILRLSTPRYKIPKRAFCNEPKHKLKFTKERAFDIAHCEVKLLPEGLIHKRLWSRKYPIVINLLPDSHLGTRWAEGKRHLLTDSEFPYEPHKNPSTKENTESTDRLPNEPKPPSPNRFSSFDPSARTITPKESLRHRSGEQTSLESSPKKETITMDNILSMDDDLPSLTINEVGGVDIDDEEEEYDEISDFVKISPNAERNYIILFARTAREKDQWFRRFVAATTYCTKSELDNEQTSGINHQRKERRGAEIDSYMSFMKSLGQFRCSFEDEFGVVTFDNINKEKENYLWFNIFLARILYDTMKEEYWIELMKSKIQKKLSVIRVPTFMEPIKLSNIEFSDTVPAIEWTHNVNLNDDGIWTEIEVSYQGTMTMTVDTKINLTKVRELAAKNQLPSDKIAERPSKTAYLDSSQEDSGETSTEESTDKPSTANKALSVIDKVAASNFFHKVTETGLGRKAMERMSNTVISLNVQVKRLVGTLVLNIPPPPSDRLWYGFKPNVEINMHAKPVFGETNISVHYITSMIEKTLRSEFQKVLVMPNMDDLVIPLMNKELPY